MVDYRNIDSTIRGLERRLEKCELREKQLIILLKKILERKTRRANKNQPNILTYEKLTEYMESIIRDRLSNGDESTDLVEELVSKSV